MNSQPSITLFGIPNCDTVKKARTWLDTHGVLFHFHNFKKDGLNKNDIEAWLSKVDLSTIINRKGTTWRALSDKQKELADDHNTAIALLIEQPSLIKRPVLQINATVLKSIHVGFDPQSYQKLFIETQ